MTVAVLESNFCSRISIEFGALEIREKLRWLQPYLRAYYKLQF